MSMARIYRIALRCTVGICAAAVIGSAGCSSEQTVAMAAGQPVGPVPGTWALAASDSLGQQVFIENPAAASLFTPQAIAQAEARSGQAPTVAAVPTDPPRQ
jgi:hypothetical protein